MEIKSDFVEKTSESDKSSARITKKKKTQMTTIRNERLNTSKDPMGY